MKFSKELYNDVVVETINLKRGTYREAADFKEALEKEIERGWKKIIVDLDKCEFMDSTFLGALINGLKKATEKGGKIKLASVHSDARILLEITGTDKIFEIFQTKQGALDSFENK
jgi:anti-sigma B factor antagonist